jgi:hypothetical protein
MLKEEFEVIDNWMIADLIISGPFVNEVIPQSIMPNFPLNKLIYMLTEPAICNPRTHFYNNFNKMFLVAVYNPTKPNEIPLTIDNKHGAEYPFPLCPVEPITRTDTTMKNRGIYQAGELGLESNGSPHGFLNIRILRRQMSEYLEQNPNNHVAGTRTKRGNTYLNDNPEGLQIRAFKQKAIKESNCDFVMAMENSIYPDYVTEKIGEGLTSDRVTLYLGAPNIEKHVPLNCFVDLRRWFNTETKIFDFEGMTKYLNELSQEEYDDIIRNAREFRKNSSKSYQENKTYLTQATINYIKDKYHKV